MGTAGKAGAFEVLQGDKSDAAFVDVLGSFCHDIVFIVLQAHRVSVGEGVGIGNKLHAWLLPGDKLLEIVKPGVRDGGAVGDDEDVFGFQLTYEIVRAQGFSETWFGIPKKLSAVDRVLEISQGGFNRLSLFGSQDVIRLLFAHLNSIVIEADVIIGH